MGVLGSSLKLGIWASHKSISDLNVQEYGFLFERNTPTYIAHVRHLKLSLES